MYRIMIGGFSHETNSFCPIRADRAAYAKRTFYFGKEVEENMLASDNEIHGFYEALGTEPEYELVPSIVFSTGPCGPVTGEMYHLALTEMIRTLREKGPFDGMLINMHGAMVADEHLDAEGDFLEALRAEAGNEIPIMVTLDLHGNLTHKMVHYATALIPCEEYPHTDCFELGIDTARLMKETLEGRCHPQMAFHPIPYFLPLFPTKFPEMAKFLEMARSMQMQADVCFARISHGFFPANIPEMGMGVVVITNGKKAKAERLAKQLGEAIWEGRDTLVRHYTPLDEALDLLDDQLQGPVVLGDGSDNPGAGGLCDTTHILKRVLERGISGAAFAVICDPASVKACEEAGEGASVCLNIGGTSDARLSGGPLRVEGNVIRILDGKYRNRDRMERGILVNMGECAVIQVAGNYVVLSSERTQVLDAEGFRCCGIVPEEQKLLVVKSAVHYRESFGNFAARLVDICLPGFCAPDPQIFMQLGFQLGTGKEKNIPLA